MRILLTADAELPVPPTLYGGIERIIASLARRFRELGHEVGLVAHRESSARCDGFFPWPGSTSTTYGDCWLNACALRRAFAKFDPDVVHSFSRLLWLLPLRWDYRPKIMSYQREPTARTVAWSSRLHGARLRFTGCSRKICRIGERAGGNWTAIPNFVDMGTFTFVQKVPDDAPLVFLSRIERIKGVHNAIAIARKAGRRLIIAGNVVEQGESGTYWREEIKPQLDRDGIEYVGPVNDEQKNKLLGQAAGLLVPVEWEEPFGIVFAEALACGTPVISSPRGALPEVVRNGVDGFLVTDTTSGAEAVGKLSSLNRYECRRRVETEFSLEVIAEKYLAVYEQAGREKA